MSSESGGKPPLGYTIYFDDTPYAPGYRVLTNVNKLYRTKEEAIAACWADAKGDKTMSRLDQSIAEHNQAVKAMASLLITVRKRLTEEERGLASETLHILDMNCVLSDSAYENIEGK